MRIPQTKSILCIHFFFERSITWWIASVYENLFCVSNKLLYSTKKGQRHMSHLLTRKKNSCIFLPFELLNFTSVRDLAVMSSTDFPNLGASVRSSEATSDWSFGNRGPEYFSIRCFQPHQIGHRQGIIYSKMN